MMIEQENEMKDGIQKTNEKLDILAFKLESFISATYEWQKQAQPTVELGNNIRGFGQVSAYALGFLAGIAGIFTALFEALKKVK